MIVAVDFDCTLSLGTHYPHLGQPNYPLIRALTQLHELGHTIILWTCREGPELKDALTWCKQYHVPIDYVNENVPWLGFDCRKIVADYYIDDCAVNVDDKASIVDIVHRALTDKFGKNWNE